MKNLNNFVSDLTQEELKTINGGDGITEAVFRFFGWVSVVIEAGLDVPHANNPSGLEGSRPFE
ncbi:MAG: hypothetical protein COZ17_11520 [Flavobacteriaceae bacterium CG_4_10_14_3_um_filter_33_47]|nr:MAG: hypothetical protein COZ17_11520 [Flavobacteriaceae bacterium CG_4_10_14_3_um_filter_33_47]PJB18193.1 MAG: hypothetical protein CO117_08910 [Flavobacteriaceae bacterium CG_4_9_14_3_um_filter_33_16]